MTSYGPIDDHALKEAGWRGFEAAKKYDGGGTLRVNFFTNVEDSGAEDTGKLGKPGVFDSQPYNIVLDDIPSLPEGQDYQYLFLPETGLAGSMQVDGEPVEGRFSCTSMGPFSCGLTLERRRPGWEGYYPFGNVLLFTPADGSKQVRLPAVASETVTPANYLSFGNWLYVPEDITAADPFEFGVFASGGDPFNVDNLMGLTGEAEYAGEAAGMYAKESGADTGSFSADVGLMAYFGTDGEYGTVRGTVSNINYSGEPLALSELQLGTVSYLDEQGTSNIFRFDYEGSPPTPGGWIVGRTAADGWRGSWSGKFFGNGSAVTDHPASFAGTFGATNGDSTLAGSFGARKR